jgi:DNA invertase Pin-like site-specific DNA recombinase
MPRKNKRQPKQRTGARLAGYVRVAVPPDEIADAVYSQWLTFREYIDRHKESRGWQRGSLHMFIETAESAASMTRRALQEMLDHVRAGEFTHVITRNIDTLTTSAHDFLEIRDLLEKHHTALVLVEDNFESGDPRSQALNGLMEMFAEFERSPDVW